MATAIWNSQVIADTDTYESVEGNVYFPIESVNPDYLQSSTHSSICPWKGTASYYNVAVDGKTNQNAAWYYAEPKDAAKNIKGHVAFWKGVTVNKK
jgi:uncharacterized protein (DUF427 family)